MPNFDPTWLLYLVKTSDDQSLTGWFEWSPNILTARRFSILMKTSPSTLTTSPPLKGISQVLNIFTAHGQITLGGGGGGGLLGLESTFCSN